MSWFRKARTDEVVRYEAPNKEDWIAYRAEFKKSEVNEIIAAAPKAQDDLSGSMSFIERFLDVAFVDWSWVDKDENKIPFTLDLYRDLANDVAMWIDKTAVEHLQKTIGGAVDDLEGKPST